jgi:hypothetical protein
MEPGEEVQPMFDRLLSSLAPESAAGVEETAAVEDTQSTDILRPNLVRPQDKPVLCAQPFH